jgi:NAD(P)-dependent dehydrogenase (short-subunit alcohol dehydrogenase family)
MTMLAKELAERLAPQNISVNSIHPGAVNTGILDSYSRFAQFFLRKIFIAPEKGARTTLYLTGLKPGEIPRGKYLTSCKEAKTHKLVDDASARAALWDTCSGYLEAVA